MKKIIDERGRLFGKISIVDLFVLLLVVLIIIALAVKSNLQKSSGDVAELDTVTYQVTIYNVRTNGEQLIKAGDAIYETNGSSVGTISDVHSEAARTPGALTDGTYADGTAEGKYDITLTIEAPATCIDGRYYVNKTWELNVNSERDYFTKYFACYGKIISIG